MQDGREDEAEGLLRRATELDPADIAALNNYAHFLCEVRQNYTGEAPTRIAPLDETGADPPRKETDSDRVGGRKPHGRGRRGTTRLMVRA